MMILLKNLVNFEFLKGICVRFLSLIALMHQPNADKLPFMDITSYLQISFSSYDIVYGILNFSDPANN